MFDHPAGVSSTSYVDVKMQMEAVFVAQRLKPLRK